ncbi:MAG: response regulator [Pirellulaceae bacterium]
MKHTSAVDGKPAVSPATATDEPTVRRRVLVAEDDRALADVIRLALSRAGFEVSVANDGQAALQLASTSTFDVVISDYQMPKINGEQLLTAVRSDSASQDASLILCSARYYELDSERLNADLRLSAIFFKPFSLAELVHAASA